MANGKNGTGNGKKRKTNGGAGGRPTEYREAYVGIAGVMCRELGANIPKLARSFGVSEVTVHRWMNVHPKFNKAIREGRDHWDTNEIERAYARRALGYDFKEKTYEQRPVEKDGKVVGSKLVLTKVLHKHVPPSEKAMEGWLYNRNRERWGLLKQHSLKVDGDLAQTVKMDHNLDLSSLSKEEKEQLVSIIRKASGGSTADRSAGEGSGGTSSGPVH